MHQDRVISGASQDKSFADLVNQVLARVGRNLLMFQKLERQLKISAACIQKKDGANRFVLPNTLTDLFEQINAGKSGKMLGQTIDRLNLGMPEVGSEGFRVYLRRVLEQRNQFVHELENSPLFGMHNATQCQKSIEFLDWQKDLCAPLLKLSAEMNRLIISEFPIPDDF